MAIAVSGGHVSRALDFYNSVGKYFILGGTTAWEDETNPTLPLESNFRLNDVVGLKRVDNIHMVIPHESGTIKYRDQNWKIVAPRVDTIITSPGVSAGETIIPVESVTGLVEGSKVRINNLYEGSIVALSESTITLDIAAPQEIPANSPVLGGALVEDARYVYVDCYLNYDEFPLVTYRQIGLCSGVTPNTADTLRAAAYTTDSKDEYTSLGVLEVIDNRIPATRNVNQREVLSLIIEF